MAVDYFKRLREGGEADRAWVRGVHPSHPFFSHEAIHSMHLEGIYIYRIAMCIYVCMRI